MPCVSCRCTAGTNVCTDQPEVRCEDFDKTTNPLSSSPCMHSMTDSVTVKACVVGSIEQIE
jgi:hypothetical protein